MWWAVIAGVIAASATVAPASAGEILVRARAPSVELHLAVSNQSLVQPQADVRVRLDGDLVFEETLPVDTQHHYRRFSVRVPPGDHLLRLEEARAGVVREASIPVEGETWVRVKYAHDASAGEHDFIVDKGTEPFPVK